MCPLPLIFCIWSVHRQHPSWVSIFPCKQSELPWWLSPLEGFSALMVEVNDCSDQLVLWPTSKWMNGYTSVSPPTFTRNSNVCTLLCLKNILLKYCKFAFNASYEYLVLKAWNLTTFGTTSVQVESGSTLSRSYILTQPVKLLLKAKLLYSDWGGKSSYRFPLFEDSL